MKCIVISLPRAEVRRQAITQQFQSLKMRFELLEAVDWRRIGQQERMLVDREARKREGRRSLSDGMIACYLSHRKAIQSVAHGNEELVAIFEDDSMLEPQIKTVFPTLELAHHQAQSFDVLFLHRNRTARPYVKLHQLDETFSIGAVKYSDSGALAYVISKSSAKRFLEFYPKIIHLVDHTLHEYWENGLKVFSLDPPVVFHSNDGVEHSFVREAEATRPRRSILSYPRRIQSLMNEEVRKRISFYRLSRTGRRAHKY